ncbi:hypothetical protein C6P45_005109 [Maudiozyma exigua]|uniref:Ribonuclease P/MRP protein subunit POP5 n=1 Tax=Maudiozyma exigua TaxID=34358 RepID=A0A9P7B9X3_MAUEX|nr:hypothetical protein C6P45_005109 [Kazachstania exigua]
MVRLKSRYVLFEITYPSQTLTNNDCKQNLLLLKHKSSPKQINSKIIMQEIRRSLQLYLGDYGYGKVNSLLQLKYFSNNTSTGILRCHREDIDLLLTALFYINKLGDNTNNNYIGKLVINPIKISGTIKKMEQFIIKRNDRLLKNININQKQNDTNDFNDLNWANDETE